MVVQTLIIKLSDYFTNQKRMHAVSGDMSNFRNSFIINLEDDTEFEENNFNYNVSKEAL